MWIMGSFANESQLVLRFFFLINFGMNKVIINQNQVLKKKKKHLLKYSVNGKLFGQDLGAEI